MSIPNTEGCARVAADDAADMVDSLERMVRTGKAVPDLETLRKIQRSAMLAARDAAQAAVLCATLIRTAESAEALRNVRLVGGKEAPEL